MNRTWAWMSGFSMTNNLLSCTLLTLAVGVYYADPNAFDAMEDAILPGVFHSTDAHGTGAHGSLHGMGNGLGDELGDGRRLAAVLEYTAGTEAERISAAHDYNVLAAHAASWDGIEPLMWLMLGIGFLLK